MNVTDPSVLEVATRALLADLNRQAEERYDGPYIDDHDLADVLIDGRANLLSAVRSALEAAVNAADPLGGESWIQYANILPGLPPILEYKGANYATHARPVKAGPWEPVERKP